LKIDRSQLIGPVLVAAALLLFSCTTPPDVHSASGGSQTITAASQPAVANDTATAGNQPAVAEGHSDTGDPGLISLQPARSRADEWVLPAPPVPRPEYPLPLPPVNAGIRRSPVVMGIPDVRSDAPYSVPATVIAAGTERAADSDTHIPPRVTTVQAVHERDGETGTVGGPLPPAEESSSPVIVMPSAVSATPLPAETEFPDTAPTPPVTVLLTTAPSEASPNISRQNAELEQIIPPQRPPDLSPLTTTTEATARSGGVVTVELPSMGWVFLGAEEGESVDYIRREYGADGITFYLRPQQTGEMRLVFDGQDLGTGRRATHIVELTVEEASPVGVVEFRPRRNEMAGTGQQTAQTAQQADPAQSAPAGQQADSAQTAQQTVQTAQQADPAQTAPAGQQNAPAQSTAILAPETAPPGQSLSERTTDELRTLAASFRTDGRIGDEREVLQVILNRGTTNYDEILFRLAQLYESQPGRDLRLARELYRQILDEYPFSALWEDSRRRVEYLNRHFFDIR